VNSMSVAVPTAGPARSGFANWRRVERSMTGLDRLSYRERLEMIAERSLS
jgi:hypothetical protein